MTGSAGRVSDVLGLSRSGYRQICFIGNWTIARGEQKKEKDPDDWSQFTEHNAGYLFLFRNEDTIAVEYRIMCDIARLRSP